VDLKSAGQSSFSNCESAEARGKPQTLALSESANEQTNDPVQAFWHSPFSDNPALQKNWNWA
jgi:hypothetical protein